MNLFDFIDPIIHVLFTLLGASVSGLSGFFVMHYQHRLQVQKEQTADMRKDLATLMTECIQLDAWASKQEKIYLSYPILPENKDAEMSPINRVDALMKIETIVLLNFPQIFNEMKEVESAGIEFVDYLQGTHEARKKINASELKYPGNPPRRAELRQKFTDAQSKLIEAIRNLLKQVA